MPTYTLRRPQFCVYFYRRHCAVARSLWVNVNKCHILHVGIRNKKFNYEMNGVKLDSVQCVKDLGASIASNLKFLEYSVQFWSPPSHKGHSKIRAVQRRVTMITSLRNKSYEERLASLIFFFSREATTPRKANWVF